MVDISRKWGQLYKFLRHCNWTCAARPTFFKTLFLRQFLPWVVNIGTPAFRRGVVESIPSKLVKESVELSDFLYKQSVMIYRERKRAVGSGYGIPQEKGGTGKDILSILRAYLFLRYCVAL